MKMGLPKVLVLYEWKIWKAKVVTLTLLTDRLAADR